MWQYKKYNRGIIYGNHGKYKKKNRQVSEILF